MPTTKGPIIKVKYDPGLGYVGEVYLGEVRMFRGLPDHDGPGTARLEARKWSIRELETRRLPEVTQTRLMAAV